MESSFRIWEDRIEVILKKCQKCHASWDSWTKYLWLGATCRNYKFAHKKQLVIVTIESDIYFLWGLIFGKKHDTTRFPLERPKNAAAKWLHWQRTKAKRCQTWETCPKARRLSHQTMPCLWAPCKWPGKEGWRKRSTGPKCCVLHPPNRPLHLGEKFVMLFVSYWSQPHLCCRRVMTLPMTCRINQRCFYTAIQ